MPNLTVVNRTGDAAMVAGEPGLSVMEILRASGFDELQALCGGCCSCATCHVVVDPAYADRMPPMSDDENDLLDTSFNRSANSRLACRIAFCEALDGLRVTIAQNDG